MYNLSLTPEPHIVRENAIDKALVAVELKELYHPVECLYLIVVHCAASDGRWLLTILKVGDDGGRVRVLILLQNGIFNLLGDDIVVSVFRSVIVIAFTL